MSHLAGQFGIPAVEAWACVGVRSHGNSALAGPHAPSSHTGRARGGTGPSAADGGKGFGGGVYNGGQSSLEVHGSTATGNTAAGGAAGRGGTAGLGEGGGLYLAPGGTVCLDVFAQAHVTHNHASTS